MTPDELQWTLLARISNDFKAYLAIAIITTTCVVLLYRAQGRVERLQIAAPCLRFGNILYHDKVDIHPNGFVADVKMWRIEVINDGGEVHDVRVTGKFTPQLPDMPGSQPIVTFHRYSDNARTFMLHGNGATEYVDLVAVPNLNHMVSYVASAEADGGYIYYEDDHLGEPQYWKVELEARAANSLAQKAVYIWCSKQWLYMTESEDGERMGVTDVA